MAFAPLLGDGDRRQGRPSIRRSGSLNGAMLENLNATNQDALETIQQLLRGLDFKLDRLYHTMLNGTMLRLDTPADTVQVGAPQADAKEVAPWQVVPTTSMTLSWTSEKDHEAIFEGEYDESTTLNQRFKFALLANDAKSVQDLLNKKIDPNQIFEDFTCNNKEFKFGSPLAIAVLNNSVEMIGSLLQAGAQVDSEYGFIAGMSQCLWYGPASHATIPAGRLELLEYLERMKADLQQKGNNGANMLWQAAHFGKTEMARALIARGLDLEAVGVSQDDPDITYTPLHKAVHAGHCGIVRALLVAKANVEANPSPGGRRPVHDAILSGYGDVIKVLISHGASLYEEDGNARVLEDLFSLGNVVAIAAVAQGLQCASMDAVRQLRNQHFVQFLVSHGSAPKDILRAVVRPQGITYWQNSRRTVLKNAWVDETHCMNVAEGPHPDLLNSLFLSKKPLTRAISKDFLDVLAPPTRSRNQVYVPVHVFACHVATPHTDSQILRALAETTNEEVFGEDVCTAIVQMVWGQVSGMHTWLTAFELLYLVLVTAINFLCRELEEGYLSDVPTEILSIAVWAGCLVWVVEQIIEVAVLTGFVACGRGRHYVMNPKNWAGQFRALLNGFVLLQLASLGRKAKSDPTFNFAQSMTVFMRWLKTLYSLRAFQSVGTRILPIMSTMFDVGPFCGVLLMYILGAINAYYALSLQTLDRSFFFVYSIVVAQDIDIHGMDNAYPLNRVQDDGIIATSFPKPSLPNWAYVRILMVFISFVMGLVMMNIFIAVLAMSYQRAMKDSWRYFMRERAVIALDAKIMSLGMRVLCCRRGAAQIARKVSRARYSQEPESGMDVKEDKFLWYCTSALDQDGEEFGFSRAESPSTANAGKSLSVQSDAVIDSDRLQHMFENVDFLTKELCKTSSATIPNGESSIVPFSLRRELGKKISQSSVQASSSSLAELKASSCASPAAWTSTVSKAVFRRVGEHEQGELMAI